MRPTRQANITPGGSVCADVVEMSAYWPPTYDAQPMLMVDMMNFIKSTMIFMVGVSIFGAAVLFPEQYQLRSLALAYAWVVIVMAWVLSIFIIAVAACVSSSDEELKTKIGEAMQKIASNHSKTPGWLKWLKLIVTTSLIALAAMPVTAVVWAMSGLVMRFINSCIENKFGKPE